jgi:hypothetical protein
MEAWKHCRPVRRLPFKVLGVIPGTILWLRGPDTFSLGRSVPATHDNPLRQRLADLFGAARLQGPRPEVT